MEIRSILTAAAQAHAAGHPAEASQLCRQILETDPFNAQATLLLGVIEAQSGDAHLAVELLSSVSRADPSSFQAPFWLSTAYRRLGQKILALQAAEAAVFANPRDAKGQAQLGIRRLEARYLPEAEKSFRAALLEAQETIGGAIQVAGSLSHCLSVQGRKPEARQVLEDALGRAGFGPDQLVRFGRSMLSQEYPEGAAAFATRALSLAPQSSQARILLARSLIDQSRVEEAIGHLRLGVEAEPENAEAVAILGTACQALGNLEEGSAMFRRSLQLSPEQGYAYFALFHNRRVTLDDTGDIARMQALVEERRLDPRQMSYLHYGLAKAHENLGEYAESMTNYDSANRIEYELKFKDRVFDRAEFASRTDRIVGSFSREVVTGGNLEGSSSAMPVFVVGMPRTGTTLIEQILSSHPRVGAAGEQMFWPDNWRQAMDASGNGLSAEGLQSLANRYLSLLSELGPSQDRMVDKMPGNRSGLGIIHLAFPNARIIHTRRHPVDTCLSIYATPNRAHVEFAHDRGNIVFAYREYLRLMDHWRSVLPSDRFLEVDYEELVTNGEPIIRQMIEFCGLDWDDRCLRPQDNRRAVITPSVWQVRQPVYRSSVARWKSFEPWLDAFAELLPSGDATEHNRESAC